VLAIRAVRDEGCQLWRHYRVERQDLQVDTPEGQPRRSGIRDRKTGNVGVWRSLYASGASSQRLPRLATLNPWVGQNGEARSALLGSSADWRFWTTQASIRNVVSRVAGGPRVLDPDAPHLANEVPLGDGPQVLVLCGGAWQTWMENGNGSRDGRRACAGTCASGV